ncbi:hypothetical protein [Cellvibrio sp. PSBB006]|uniref:hypothetical protein n=1 Tax=Cellvibrio sp. PSBB006 TaxID=1987723 RepID=UPI000B3B0C76|nr:hypothetical protein [Cellvibrio sp. PSBB006]ARU28483.1 hypothetical protein CBR65_14125 [Cellvibrio sp. PSBB006]
MNIETLARIIEGADISVFRSIAAILTPLIGLQDVDYCDGPYDGGKDFTLATMPANGVKIGIQISVEKGWQAKLEKDAAKLKSNFDSNVMYFISSRRIPEGSFEKVKESVFSKLGVTVNKYDNQAIATRLINYNKVNEALALMGIQVDHDHASQSKYLGPKNEAVSSLLLFDADSKDLRQRFFQSIIMSSLSRISGGESRDSLILNVKKNYSLDETQSVQIGANIDRLLQTGELISDKGVIRLADSVFNRFVGLQKSTELELSILKSDFDRKISDLLESDVDIETKSLLLENFLELVVHLSGKQYNTYEVSSGDNVAFESINSIIEDKFGKEKSTSIFKELSDFFASSEFCKHIACAKLYEAFLNTKSSHLINALGGTEDLNVYIDSSVFIPVICGVLFDKVSERFSQSGAALHQLIKDHKFKAIVPHDYMEEVASHLIEACRDYKHIIEKDIDLSFSGNAFVSHYSNYRKKYCDMRFEDYVKVFGARLSIISADMTDQQFYSIRDRITTELSGIAARYNFLVEKQQVEYFGQQIDRLKEFLFENNISKPEVLIKHDARVITYLSGDYVRSGVVKLLCTWDKLHSMINPEGASGYYVMHPIAIIDYLSLAKGGDENRSVSHLLDFAAVQEEKDLELSAKIWDSIAKIESENLSDGQLILSAKEFKHKYMSEHANADDFIPNEIEKSWMAWKK